MRLIRHRNAERALLLSAAVLTSVLLIATSGTALASISSASKHSPMSPPVSPPVSPPPAPTPTPGPPPTELEGKIDAAITAIEDASPGDFVQKNHGATLVNQLRAIKNKIKDGDNRGARSQLENAILPKVDSCSDGKHPGGNSWIKNCDAQSEIYEAITALIAALGP